MSENVPPPGAASDSSAGNAPGKPYYYKATAELQAMLKNQAALKAKLLKQNNEIYDKETYYLDNTPNGNIVIGFDNYTKGTVTGAGTSRRRGTAVDDNRIFSASDQTWNPDAVTLLHLQSLEP